MTQPRIDTSSGFLKIDCLQFDLLSGHDSDNDCDSPLMAPVVHERSNMVVFFALPEEPQRRDEMITSELELENPLKRKVNSARSEHNTPFQDIGDDLFEFELLSEASDDEEPVEKVSLNEQHLAEGGGTELEQDQGGGLQLAEADGIGDV